MGAMGVMGYVMDSWPNGRQQRHEAWHQTSLLPHSPSLRLFMFLMYVRACRAGHGLWQVSELSWRLEMDIGVVDSWFKACMIGIGPVFALRNASTLAENFQGHW